MALKAALERRGVQVSGVALAKHWVASGPPVALKEDATGARIKAVLSGAAPAGLPSLSKPRMPLAMHESPNLAEDVLYTLKESQNLHAEVMMRNLGVALAGDPTPGTARALERAYLTGPVGIAAGDLVLYDGSGLSGHDLVTPRALTQLLVYAAKQPWFGTFKGALPVGGMDGTLRNRFAAGKSPLTGKVFAKTGTLGESRDLSGYVTAADGRTLVFSVMVDNHVPGTNAEALAMDRMVETIAGSAKP
jgi:D-alanyl-D-alanine carboxypeptidase/D-alanyl-D-alanine-endopeptidase (penicillin-binding protein 4)